MPRNELGDAVCFIIPEFSEDAISEGGIVEVVFWEKVVWWRRVCETCRCLRGRTSRF